MQCYSIEYRSFYLVVQDVVLLPCQQDVADFETSTRSSLDYILYVSIRALVLQTLTNEHTQKNLTIMFIFSPNAD